MSQAQTECPHCGHTFAEGERRLRLELEDGPAVELCSTTREPHDTSCAVAVAIMINKEPLGARGGRGA